jgi:hypothetical protein
MTERLLQFIWQFQYFNRNELATTTGEFVQTIFPGNLNRNQGPDFSDAKIKIGKTTWAGTVELHLKTSDWKKHNHENDKNYKNVILHAVWENDETGLQNSMPVIELRDRVPKILLTRYEELMNSQGFIPCEKNISSIRDITWKAWKERLAVERLLRKSENVEAYLSQNKFHWEETFWWLLARNVGIKVNADAFEQMARTILLNLLAKHKNQIHQVEALLFGQSGMLEGEFKEDYPKLLRQEYHFLKKKYQLNKIHQPVHFLRMRPGNFPTIRLAQLAGLITESSHLFSKIKEAGSTAEIKKWLAVTANDYWHYHYKFDEPSVFKKKKLGDAMINNIIINTVCPVLFAWGNYHDDDKYKNKALHWLEEISPEKNSVTKGFQDLGIGIKNACDSQALIELRNEYCIKKRCLDCAVGNAILKS